MDNSELSNWSVPILTQIIEATKPGKDKNNVYGYTFWDDNQRVVYEAALKALRTKLKL